MKKVKNLVIILLLLLGSILITGGLLYSYYTGKAGKSNDLITVVIEKGMSSSKIGEVLEENELIKSASFFKLYLKLYDINDLKAGTYELAQNMKLSKIIEVIRKGNSYNENEISITFQEGINMRKIATIISENTNNTYNSVLETQADKEYLQTLIDKYWFLTDEILNKKIYYPLEGYLFPNTYNFSSKDVTVKEIFEKLLNQMEKELNTYKETIEKSKFSVHEILTLASIAELEVNNKADVTDRKNVIGVFINRLEKKMSLGSDITTRYSIKLDDKRPMTKKEYQTINDYNTRSSSLAGKLPAGPIGMVSSNSLEASVDPIDNDYIFFISNIKTNETFFFKYSKDFEKKKKELASVNQGY